MNRIVKVIKEPKRIFKFVKNQLTKQLLQGYCPICGNNTSFIRYGDNLRETFSCEICGSKSRERYLAIVLCNFFGIDKPYSIKRVVSAFPHLKIYQAQASGPIHNLFNQLDGYIGSEFFHDIPLGKYSDSGIRCEDLQKLSFPDNTFDLVITQDVFEHIRNPDLGWKEVHRVLKPSGLHIFTIPYNVDSKTVRRIEVDGDKDIFILPRVFHGDNIRNGLVYTDFGNDLLEHLASLGLPAKIFKSTDSDEEQYRIFWSRIFISQKML